MAQEQVYDVLVIGGGPIGWATGYEIAKAGKTVAILEQSNFFNQAGSSTDLCRMFRTMYTENYMADLAKESMGIWDELEKEAGVPLRSMTGLLNFGDPTFGDKTPEGTLEGPVDNLNRLHMKYEKLNAKEIEQRWPFKNLPENYVGIYAPDNGVINVPLLLRTLARLAKLHGTVAHQYVQIKKVEPHGSDLASWKASGVKNDTEPMEYVGRKVVLTCGAYINHVLEPSFDMRFDLKIWEMTSSYFSVDAEADEKQFPSMWFQFAGPKERRPQLFYGFPVVEWGPPNVARIAVDAATQEIDDPKQRKANYIDPGDIRNVQDFVKERLVGVDSTVPFFSSTCLQTNTYDNEFVLDFVPEEYLKGGAANSIAVFTAGWAMKFVPLIGRALRQLMLDGKSQFDLSHFSMTREDKKEGKRIIVDMRPQKNVVAENVVAGTESLVKSVKEKRVPVQRERLAMGSSLKLGY